MSSIGSNWKKAKQQHFLQVCFNSDWCVRMCWLAALCWPLSPPTGHFKKYTAYRVSLFAVSHGNKVHHLSSVIGYSLQKGIFCVPFFFLNNVNRSCLTSDRFIKKLTADTSQMPSAPSRVPSFELMSIAATEVKLCWEPLSLSKQEGLVLYYQIGVDQKGNGNYYNK